jgi:hypothetical protein
MSVIIIGAAAVVSLLAAICYVIRVATRDCDDGGDV